MTELKLLEEKRNIGIKLIKLKSKLQQLEQEAYAKFKEENPTSRTAMDKVIAEAKAKDSIWQDLENQYNTLKITHTFVNDLVSIVTNMVYSDKYSKEDVEEIVNEFFKRI